jgi:serine/threonine-protein kinase RsbT
MSTPDGGVASCTMSMRQVRDALGAHVLVGEDQLGAEVSRVYASDLMSDVLAFGEPDSVLLTGLANQQTIISAHMAEFGGVVLVRGKQFQDASEAQARRIGLVLMRTDLDLYEACVRLNQACDADKGASDAPEAAEPEEEILLQKELFIEGSDFSNAGMMSTEVKSILKKIGYDAKLVRRVAISAYEAEMNVVMHAVRAKVHLAVTPSRVRLTIDDEGKGIPDLDQAMQPGFTTSTEEMRAMGFGAGMGLPNIKKNTTSLDISSVVGKGTTLRMLFEV